MSTTDTIAAVATPPGRGGVGIVRMSGPDAARVCTAIAGAVPEPRIARFRRLHDQNGAAIDDAFVLYFPAPASFTGEDVVEFQAHGSPVVMDLLLAELTRFGVRLARPGEFSERAFLNDKLDLAQAEAIADLIDSASATAARAALSSLHGAFSTRVHDLVDALTALRILVEAAIDFPEEEIDFLADDTLVQRLDDIEMALGSTLDAAAQGALLREGLHLVIAGRPNAGKSSLLNALAGRDTAIVTDIPGTTRDVLRERIDLDGLPLHLVDTAGIRASDDPVEREGIRRARAELEKADHLLLVVDARNPLDAEDRAILAGVPAALPVTVVHNKIDLLDDAPRSRSASDHHEAWVSAKTGAGFGALREHLKAAVGYHPEAGGTFAARRRHLDALRRAAAHLADARTQLCVHRAGELLAEDLRLAQNVLGEITGAITSDELLGRIFSSFCIGK